MSRNVDDGAAARIGSTLRGKWVLEELIGVGGMASVYAARHKIGRRDAIKILHQKVAESEQLRARFEQEAHAVNAFRHPGVVEIRDVDTAEDGAPFLVMELLEGESLAQRVKREHSLDSRVMLDIAGQVLDVLAAAHARGIVHRDIKPDNIFLSKDGKVKVLDFGIARVRSADKRALTTKAGVTLGTMAYMAPEQARGEEIDGRADVYAVGATMFRCLAGRIVHDADSQSSLVMRVIAHGAPRLRTIVRDIDPNIAAVVDRALAFDRGDRYPDAGTMLSDLRLVQAGMAPPYATTAPEIPEPSRDSLFGGASSEAQGKPTVMPAKLQQQREPVAFGTQVGRVDLDRFAGAGRPAPGAGPPSAATRVGGAGVPADALPSLARPSASPTRVSHEAPPVSAPTRISHDDALPSAALPSMPAPLSERVVIVPSRQGGVTVQSASAGAPNERIPANAGSDIATLYGHAPPPMMPPPPAPSPSPPAASPVLTPFGELSAFIQKRPSTTLLAIGGGVAVIAVLLMVVAIAWVATATSKRADEAAAPSDVAPASTTTQTARPRELPPPPAPRKSRK